MTTGERMKARRKELGLSAEDIANALNVSRATVFRYEKGDIEKMPGAMLEPLAEVLHTTPAYLMGWEEPKPLARRGKSKPSNATDFNEHYMAPIVGTIPAGYPALAFEDIEGYASIPYSDTENYFFLRISEESMINAGIQSGDLVLIRKQSCAEYGQIVAARVSGDEATLKRYKPQEDTVLLLPENPDFEPILVRAKDFDDGYANIIGVAIEVRHTL